MNSPQISVIMLTYNRENLVSCAIESILAQTFQNYEFIIVDNGSTDSSGEVAEKYAAIDARIRVIHRERGNIGIGRNTGLDAAVGEYIAFIDDDDYCEPDFLSFLYNMAVSSNADVAVCGSNLLVNDEKEIMSAEDAVRSLLQRKRYNVAFPTKLIRSSLFETHRFKNSGKYDDIYLMPIILAYANKVVYHGLPKYTFNRHNNNNSAWTTDHSLINPEILHEYLDVYRQRTVWLSERFPSSIEKWKYFEWSFMLSMVEKVTRLKLESCYDLCNSLTAELKANHDAILGSSLVQSFEREWMAALVL